MRVAGAAFAPPLGGYPALFALLVALSVTAAATAFTARLTRGPE
ncbi:hypothetical protein [Streptomyces sp. NPDC093225]